MESRYMYAACVKLLPLLLVLLLTSCYEDEVTGNFSVSNMPTKINISLAFPKMKVVTRGSLTNEQMNGVESVWIRTYSSNTGLPTSDWLKKDAVHADNETATHDFSIATKSGYNYIVAVANVDNEAVVRNPDGSVSAAAPLSELLEKADTWDDFLSISVVSPSSRSALNTPELPLAMSGCYSTVPLVQKHGATDWSTVNFTPTFIPAVTDGKEYKMEGVIHMRRLVSHINFNITNGNPTQITISPQSYRVYNVPTYTWLYERLQGQKGIDKAFNGNFGDYAVSQIDAEKYYVSPAQFAGTFITDNGNNTFSFDFWQGESKHTALDVAACDSYAKRELENKTSIDPEPNTNPKYNNTGLYVNLTGDTWTPNNMATYVQIRCDVTYKGAINTDENGNIQDPDTEGGNVTYRSGTAEYVVHLGYCEGDNDAAKASDFNCRRNTDYTYTVTINGIDDIRVDALADNESYPGEEGLVSDITNPTIELDCHYGSFNVQLTDEELKDFGYIIQAFEDGIPYYIDESTTITEDNEKYLKWIELHPTTDENTFALYNPNEVFTLDAIRDGTYKHSATGYYTVFVNEYTYESSPDESQSEKWTRYVNQDNRRFYLRVTKSVSPDGQSTYLRSKYAVTQRSIQTYYSAENLTDSKTALGVEHANESFGLNLRSSFFVPYFSSDKVSSIAMRDKREISDINGRWNTWQWIDYRGKAWNTVLDQQQQQEIFKLDNVQGYSQDGGKAALPKLKNYDENDDSKDVHYYNGNVEWKGNSANSYDPQHNSTMQNHYVEAINACMNRNRDNNGDGVIDPEELRWYVPTIGRYLRIILGRNSLEVPIMDYKAGVNTTLTYESNKNGQNSRLLYFSSDGRILWAMEGLSSSYWGQWEGGTNPRAPWQVRCIRNLGTNLSTITQENKVDPAYRHDGGTRTVYMSNYEIKSIRTAPCAGNGNAAGQMPLHTIDDAYNMCYNAFEYSEGSQSVTNGGSTMKYDGIVSTGFTNAGTLMEKINENPCKTLDGTDNGGFKTGWRLPNQKELAIMRNLGLIKGLGGDNYVISCSMTYYNRGGVGSSTADANKFFVMSREDAIVQGDGTDNKTYYYRCVRDKQ